MKKMFKLTWAVAAMMAFSACSNVEDDVESPVKPGGDGSLGTVESPYSVEEIIEMNPQAGETAKTAVWAEGYIVGVRDYQTNPEAAADDFDAEGGFAETANVYLASEAGETNYKKCISIQLVPELRAEVNLKDNPDNYGKLLKVRGDVMRYNSVPGVKNMDAYSLDGGEVVEKPVVEADKVEVSGNVDEALTSYSADFNELAHETDFALEGWMSWAIVGDRHWRSTTYHDTKYVQATAHGAAEGTYETWVVSPGFNLDAATNKSFSVDIAKAYFKETTTFDVIVLQNVDGKTTQTKLDVKLPTDADDHVFVNSGIIDLSSFSGVVYIGFKYVGLGGQSNSTTWRIDNFQFGEVSADETTVAISATGASVKVNEALNCVISTTVSNPEGATAITAEGTPAWATFADNGDGTATITGTAPAEAGQFAVTIKATNNGVEATSVVTINVTAETSGDGGPIEAANEIGTFENWTSDLPQGWFKYDAMPLKETTIVKSGSVAARMKEKSSLSQEDRVKLEPGTYTLSYDYYLVAATGNTGRIWCTAYDAPENKNQTESMKEITELLQPQTYLPKDVLEQWSSGSHEFVVTETTYLFVQLRSYAGADIIFDNVAIAKK